MKPLPTRSFLAWIATAFLLVAAGAHAQALIDPPARAATLSHMEGSVAFAPARETEWSDAVRNRPVTTGDRLWTDEGARAELHLGTAALHLDSRTFIDVIALDDNVMQASLNEGGMIVRVRRLDPGENFEIDTPHLAFQALQPGDYRLDVDPARGFTRVTVRSGAATLSGAGAGTMQMRTGQQMAFAGRNLAAVTGVAVRAQDAFDLWAADRNRAEDQSIAARHVPRDVVGYSQLDAYGSWAQDPDYGAIWFPRVAQADWAPYRYGRWEWVNPWGWTWVDDAPWGFAPFHYGRWAQVGPRWAWVPGALGPHPVYAPALVSFVGGGAQGIGWYPLAPGEAWQPFFAASPRYVRGVNRHAFNDGRGAARARDFQTRDFHRRPDAITAVRPDDFARGRPVHQQWSRMSPADLGRAQAVSPPAMQAPRREPGMRVWPHERDMQGSRQSAMPAPQGQPHEQVQRQLRAQQEQQQHWERQQQVQREQAVRQQMELQELRRREALQMQGQQRAMPAIVHPAPLPQSQSQPQGEWRGEWRGDWRGRDGRGHDGSARGQRSGRDDDDGRGQGRGHRFHRNP